MAKERRREACVIFRIEIDSLGTAAELVSAIRSERGRSARDRADSRRVGRLAFQRPLERSTEPGDVAVRKDGRGVHVHVLAGIGVRRELHPAVRHDVRRNQQRRCVTEAERVAEFMHRRPHRARCVEIRVRAAGRLFGAEHHISAPLRAAYRVPAPHHAT